jgi:membrane protein required for beta-lactamase induction
MTDRIEPALSEAAWRYWLADPDYIRSSIAIGCDAISYDLRQEPARLLALANAALPDSDPRKITRTWVTELRGLAVALEKIARHAGASDEMHAVAERIRDRADALASYLPLEEP